VRRWRALAGSEPRRIGELNPLLARLAKFSRAETRKMRRRIVTEPGPAGDRQAIVGHLSLAHGAEKPVMLTREETLALPAALALAALLALVCKVISRIFEASRRTAT
jgi:N-acetylmuramoyl-L-alanine amidase